MPGQITRIAEIINGQLPTHSAAFVRMMGTAFPVDLYLRGTTRFARKIGNVMPLIMSDNTTSMMFDSRRGSNEIITIEALGDIVLGTKLLIQDSELVTVDDFRVVQNRIMRIKFKERLLTFHPKESEVLLWGHPLTVLDTPGGTPFVINLSSSLPIYPIDTIAVGRTSYPLQDAVLAGELNGVFTYQLTLKDGLSVPTSTTPLEGDTIYLRGNPAYESNRLCVPTIPPSQVGVGCFCLDWFSGVTTEDSGGGGVHSRTSFVNERMLISASDAADVPLWTKEVDKNFLVSQVPIQNDSMLFWDKLRGSLNWNGTEVLCYPDDGTLPDADNIPTFQLHYKCVPPLLADGQVNAWRLPVVNDNPFPMFVTVQLEPLPPVTVQVPANTAWSIVVPLLDGSPPVERIWLSITSSVEDTNGVWVPGNPGVPILPLRVKSWLIDKNAVGFLRSVFVAEARGRNLWASGGLMVKPIFLSLEYLKARIDINGFVNRGLLAL